MKMIKSLAILTSIFLVLPNQLFGQDTVTYYQQNASMFTNTYTFIKKNKSDKFGTFIQYVGTDDGQCWNRQGTFTEKNRTFHLTFDTIDLRSRIEFKSDNVNEDMIVIAWYDWLGAPQFSFNVRYADSLLSDYVYYSDWERSIVRIPRTELKDTNLIIYAFSNKRRELANITISNEIRRVNLYVSDCILEKSFDNKHITLKKTINGFVAVGMWTNGKKTKFVRQSN